MSSKRSSRESSIGEGDANFPDAVVCSVNVGRPRHVEWRGQQVLTAIWKEVGFFVIIFLAGLQNVPRELHEAASLDGAGPVARLRYITLPLIKPVSAVVAVMAVIRGFQSFSPQVVLTGGSFDTEVVNLFVYKTAFASARMGRASAVAVMMFVLLALVTLAQLRVFRRTDR